jgi:glucokinase
MNEQTWAVGVDLGGTKIEIAAIDADGAIVHRFRFPTHAQEGKVAIESAIVQGVRQLMDQVGSNPQGVGIGVAGQIKSATGEVIFAPNLEWQQVPLKTELERALLLPVTVVNDVRAATWGEWLFGAGQEVDDLVCLFIGTGIGGGVVMGGQMIYGCAGTAGELGHTTIDWRGPVCKCGRRGCLEAFAGGASLARQARSAIEEDPTAGPLIRRASLDHEIDARHIVEAYRQGDPLAIRLITQAREALVVGCANLVNAFNPARLVLGGGVVQGLPELIPWLREGVPQQALAAAVACLEILPAAYGNDAGVVGAACVAMRAADARSSARD